MMNYRILLLTGEELLNKNNITDAKFDAWILMQHIFNISRSDYLLNSENEVSDKLSEEYLRLIAVRATHKPVQHIVGQQEFMGLPFLVNEHVLIPRQDTETLVEQVISIVKENENVNYSILDMCTGSGCIAISLAKYLNLKKIIGVDISEEALKVARINALNNNVSVEFVKSDLFENINEKFSIIVSNPPYIRTKEIDDLMIEVKCFEPINALDGGLDGLEFYRLIIVEAKSYLLKNGFLLLEIGYDEAESIIELLEINNYKNIKLFKDLAGLDRILVAQENFINIEYEVVEA